MQLPKLYEPAEYEDDIYSLWEKSGAFKPAHRGNKGSFSIVIPPPNANGNLHLGHGLTLGLEDIVIRYQRMLGKAVLFLPGADHAGFETQAVYEKVLASRGQSRFDFTRDELYAQIWDFVAQNRALYETQFRRLGASLDWEHYTYTLDDKIIQTAYPTFKKLWDEGLVYRGDRLVNFCTFHGTGFADIEVEYAEEAGHLWHIRYPLTDGSGEVVVATTRPETMLGDTAVAVHPDDSRYKAFHGKTVKLPLTNREIPIIVDDFVDPDFGTGAVKITPAHDPNDYEAGKRHDLPFITVITHEGKLSHEVPEPYQGLEVLAARQAVVDDLTEAKLLSKTESHHHNVGHCYKCGTVIQPLMREQWFINMQPLAKKALSALKSDKITFYPEGKKLQLITYLKGLRDWNISRQIAWGIPIPAFQNLDDPEDWIYDERVSEEVITVDGKTYRRDPDVFDTWFSSSSWPYSTLGYPEGEDYKQFYPLSLMETGTDILYPWVSRMIMLGLYTTKTIPFESVYLHGLILDAKGAKMSKSKNNMINPMDKIDLYGADALRLGLITGQSAGNNQSYDENRLVSARNFCNKLWNVARYVQTKVGEDYERTEVKAETAADHWMLSKLQHSIEEISKFLDDYRFSEAGETVYHLLWDDMADWYLEVSKKQLNTGVLVYALETILKLAHPFVPFVTETIWQTLKWEGDSLLITSSWPKAHKFDRQAAAEFEQTQAIINEIRFIRTSLRSITNLTLYHTGSQLITSQSDTIKAMTRLDAVKKVRDGYGLHLTSTTDECWLDLDQVSAAGFIKQLADKQTAQAAVVTQLEARLAKPGYTANAPKHLVAETELQLKQARALLGKVTGEYERFKQS